MSVPAKKPAATVPVTKIEPAVLVQKPTTHQVPGKLDVTDYFFKVPLDHDNPGKETITLFGRSATTHGNPIVPLTAEEKKKELQKPFLCYLEGGPGFGNGEPQSHKITKYITDRGYQVLFLDYRGVGASTPVTADTLALRGNDKAQAEYLKHFRADNNVKDLEAVRLCLTENFPEERKAWSIFGQSFGGFVSLTYLSFYPTGLREVFLTGGLAPINRKADDVYRATLVKLSERNAAYYAKYPEDRDSIFELTNYLKKKGPINLPSGGFLTAERLMSMGMAFGAHGGLDGVHNMIVRMQADRKMFGFLTRPTLSNFELTVPFDDNPIYALLHESIYNYDKGMMSNWSAHRVMQNDVRFSWLHNPEQLSGPHKGYEQELYFAGEMVFPFYFDGTFPELAKLKGVANILAKEKNWPKLYDVGALEHNTVPVYSATYVDDMYVDYTLAKQTAAKIRNVKTFETNTMYHNALRTKADDVLRELFALRDDTMD